MKRIPWKYLAGFVDGEGCIDVQVTKIGGEYVSIRPRLRIAQAGRAKHLLEQLQTNFGGHTCTRKFENPVWDDPFSWELAGYKAACPILRNIVNHLILKKEQARFCLWMETNLKGRHVSAETRDAVRDELKLMKRDPQRLSERAQERIAALL
jgi:hypothetical protein